MKTKYEDDLPPAYVRENMHFNWDPRELLGYGILVAALSVVAMLLVVQ